MNFLSVSEDEGTGGQGQRRSSCAAGGWAHMGEGVRAALGGKMTVKLPGYKILSPTLPCLWDSVGHLA